MPAGVAFQDLESADVDGIRLAPREATENALEAYEKELEWVVVSKAAIQTYGLILDNLVSQTLPLSQDLFYWDEVLSSYRYTLLYSLQTSPQRLWQFSNEIYEDAWKKFEELRSRR